MANHILFLGESAPARMLYASLLRKNHYQVSTAAHFDEAVEVVRRDSPDIVVVYMSEGSPSSVMAALKSRRVVSAANDVPYVVLLDKEASPLRRLEGLVAGARDVLPAETESLLLLARLRGILRETGGSKERRRRQMAAASLGFAESSSTFQAAASVSLVSADAANPGLVRALEAEFGSRFRSVGLKDSLSGTEQRPCDVYVLDCSAGATRDLLSALPDLRARDHSRHSAILVIHRSEDWNSAVTALTGGASDLTDDAATNDEVVHRVKMLMKQKTAADDLRRNSENGMRLAATDPLTGLFNRRYAETYFNNVIQTSEATREPFAVMLVDVDHFKAVNDSYGHSNGDIVLKEIAHRMTDNLRSVDLVARYGGEEFLVVMPGTDVERAALVANRLRARISDFPIQFPDGNEIAVTVSAGLTIGGLPEFRGAGAAFGTPASRVGKSLIADNLIRLADSALYTAKAAGRDRIEFALNPS